jgi:hypothetical protein
MSGLHAALIPLVVAHRANAPLNEFLRVLGLPETAPESIRWSYEYRRIDLALWCDGRPYAALEFKTDQPESPGWSPTQTVNLAGVLSADGFRSLLYVTLGDSEYSGGPESPAFVHVGLRQWCDAVKAAVAVAPEALRATLLAYLSEYEAEDAMRAALAGLSSFALSGADLPFRVNGDPFGSAPRVTPYMSILAKVRRRFIARWPHLQRPRLYIHGAGKDTILNFGEVAHPRAVHDVYFEINKGGRLSAKVERGPRTNGELASLARAIFGEAAVPRVRDGNNVTIATWDIGLRTPRPCGGDAGVDEVVDKIAVAMGL